MLATTDHMNESYAADYPYQPQAAVIAVGAETDSHDLWARWFSPRVVVLAVILGVCFLASDAAVGPLIWIFHQGDAGAVAVFVLFGAILAQAALLCCGLVLGPSSFWKRLLCFWIGTAICFGLWTVGLVIGRMVGMIEVKEINAAVRLGWLSAPLVAIATQWPLWFFRVYGGWRLACGDDHEEKAPAIRDYFIGTAIVAVAITLARQGLHPRQIDEQFWAVWSVVIVIAGCLCLVSVVPAVLLMFRCDWRLGLAALLLYAGVVPSSFLGIAFYAFGSSVSLLDPEAAGIVLMFVSFAAFLALGLKAIRDAGFGLLRGRRALPRKRGSEL